MARSHVSQGPVEGQSRLLRLSYCCRAPFFQRSQPPPNKLVSEWHMHSHKLTLDKKYFGTIGYAPLPSPQVHFCQKAASQVVQVLKLTHLVLFWLYQIYSDQHSAIWKEKCTTIVLHPSKKQVEVSNLFCSFCSDKFEQHRRNWWTIGAHAR